MIDSRSGWGRAAHLLCVRACGHWSEAIDAMIDVKYTLSRQLAHRADYWPRPPMLLCIIWWQFLSTSTLTNKHLLFRFHQCYNGTKIGISSLFVFKA